jgi:thiamine-monophosphate kinase
MLYYVDAVGAARSPPPMMRDSSRESASIPLGKGTEFDLIREFLAVSAACKPGVASFANVLVGPGDDCAVVTGDGIAVSVDMAVEGIHFRRDWLDPKEIGYRAAAAALSDLAAVAATPIGMLVALALRPGDAESAGVSVMQGAAQAAAAVNAVLLGGDVTRTDGPLIIDVVVVGNVLHPVLRTGAVGGDVVWVTGELGAAAAAVRVLRRGESPGPAARLAFASPTPRIVEAAWLARHGVMHALIDLSDGLAGDAGHIAAASDVRIIIDVADVPIHPAALEEGTSTADALRLAIASGDDYELCFTAAAGAVEPLVAEFVEKFGVRLTRVGSVTEGSGVRLRDAAGQVSEMSAPGYDHFAEPSV